MKKIGILGSGAVAQTLAAGFSKYGYSVKLGSRNPGKLTAWKDKTGTMADIGTLSDAAAFGDILVLAIKGDGAVDAMKMGGLDNFSGKTVIDTTNPIANEPPVNGVLRFFTPQNQSLMEQLQALAPAAKFVKAFNSVGHVYM